MRFCVVVPTYDNPATVRGVVEGARPHVPDVIVVDDGSGPEARSVLERLSEDGLAQVFHRATNGGKGAAVKDGLGLARGRGFTHAVQIDADGQHDLADLPRFLEAARERPEALILGRPVFDEDAPKSRVWGRELTNFWAAVEVGERVIEDALCGYRVYPVAAALAANATGDRMDFDPEVAVRMVWNGVPVVHVPTRVRYVSAADGGVSHFDMRRDNLAISAMHSRLMLEKLFGRLLS